MKEKVMEVKSIVKEFPGVRALKGVNFDVYKGEVHALCGENGAGKSTLMHILAGVYKQDSGEIFLNEEKINIQNQRQANDKGISIVFQERSLVYGLSVAENIFAGRQPVARFGKINYKSMNAQAKQLLDSLKMDINPLQLVSQLSPPQQQMVEIAKALSQNPKVLILDEPTATITEKEIGALFNLVRLLKQQGMAIVYISHRLAEIFEIADRVTVFKDGEHIATEAVANVDKLWLINKMVGRELNFSREERKIEKNVIFEVRSLNGAKFRNVNFALKKGEIISFAGLAGAGRTEVMRAVFGADPVYSGEVLLENRPLKIRNCKDAICSGIGYLPEDRKLQGLFLEMSISNNIISANLDSFKKGIVLDRKSAFNISKEYRQKLNIVTPSIKQKVINLSGGNQQKVVLAKWLLVCPKILIVDEPTRGIDVGSKAEIYDLLRQLTLQGTSIILVSSELTEVLAISDRIYIMYNGMITGELSGAEATETLVMRYASGLNEELPKEAGI